MVDKNKIIELINRDKGQVGYTIPDTGTRRTFTPGETKKVTFDEIERLSWAPGGKAMLQDYLIINDQEAAEEILGNVEPEYFYTKESVDILLKNGTADQLRDTLEFAPKGVVDLVKQEAVDIKLDSTEKRDIIKEATNFNVSNAIEINKICAEADEARNDAANSSRRAVPIAATSQKETTSSVETKSRYKIIQ
jgi:hypothetical protein